MIGLAAAAVYLLAAVDAPVTDVTVYSDRARVTRTAKLTLHGTQQLELATLLDSADPSTLRVEARGAEVVRVDLQRLEPDSLPVDEARTLLAELNANEDAITRASSEQAIYREQADALFRIAPQASTGDPLKPLPRLESSGWGQAMTFIAQTAENLQTHARDAARRIEELQRQREALQEKARVIGGAQRRSGYRVTGVLSGNGPATVELTYVTLGARWYPSYDLTLAPDKGRVQVAFSGLVSQETGEDWTEARLTLSTAVPSTTMKLPELASWKIGERDRFIPMPVPKPQYVRPAPSVPPEPALTSEEDVLRQRLWAAANLSPQGRAAPEEKPALDGYGRQPGSANGYGARATKRPVAQPSMPPPPSPPPSRAYTESAAPSAAPSAALSESDSYEYDSLEVTSTSDSTRAVPTSEFSLAPPSVYVPPTYSPELPAALAGGYDLAWPSLAKETVQSGKGSRRVALFSQSWPVGVERRAYPALAPEAYLVAQLKSPSPTPLPGGNAQLFVGADPAGTARLELVAPGETFTLPLGLDRAVKPIRNVDLVTSEKGLIGKDDVNRYVVRTEIANPYPVPIFIKVFDQWPLTDDKDVEVKLLETRPWAIQDPVKGSLEWDLTIPPGKKTEVSFTYTLRRPKNWRLHQQ